MTDIAPSAPLLPGLSPAQVQSAREHWVGLGLDPLAFDAASLGQQAPTTPPGSPPSQAAAPDRPDALNLSPQQRGEMAQALIAVGVPREAIEAALKADGEELPAEPPTPLTPEEAQFQAAFGAAAPHEIKVDYVGRMAPGTTIEALAQFNREATTWASEVGFPASIGAAVIERAMDVGRAYTAMGEFERSLWVQEQTALFERMSGGPEKAAERLSKSAAALKRAGPEFTQKLLASGALHDAGLIVHLANQAERASR